MKDLRDYRTLYWTPDMDDEWSDAAVERYVRGGCEGVLYRMPTGVQHASLDFLLALQGLRYLKVEGPVADDTAVNAIETLEHLTLLTACRLPVAVDRLQALHDLTIDALRDLSAVCVLTSLQRLYVGLWRGPDLAFLGPKPMLIRLRLDGRSRRLSLEGTEGCPNLRDLEVRPSRVPSLAPLRDLTALERIVLTGPRSLPTDNDLDLDDLAGRQNLGTLVLITPLARGWPTDRFG